MPDLEAAIPQRTLVFDFETKPGAYWYDDATTTLVCAWAAKFVGDESTMSYFMVPDHLLRVTSRAVGQPSHIVTREAGMILFTSLWSSADRVLTHNGKRFDVPVVNGALDRLGLPPLEQKPHVDTLVDRRSTRGVKRSLEALAERYELGQDKLGVSSETWERAYEFEPEAIRVVLERAVSDVELTERLYTASLERGVLR